MVALTALNQQLWLLQRVVIHPTYRGAGIAAGFVRRACGLCPVDWIETLSAMGQVNPFFERAGFVRAGVIRKERLRNGERYPLVYGSCDRRISAARNDRTSFDKTLPRIGSF